ncbi:beta-ketoacyl synthase N-terminal-like domain-containing protein [Nocardia sp. NPDC051052]|uniref:beta-ketoacyl synthase N-terminal-like domain-containing protein n=1 Tax=Nocardia sp. NPDC051052 TaxID=3364322 RepID=UPI00379C1E35
MRLAINGYAARTCLGDAEQTFSAMCRNVIGASPLRQDRGDAARLGIGRAFQVPGSPSTRRASTWLAEVVTAAVADAGLDVASRRVAVVVGTGLRELPTLERWSRDGADMRVHELHFAEAVRNALPGVVEVLTLCNACSAGNHALAVATDMIAAGEADAAVVAACDAMSESMLAAIARTVGEQQTGVVRPFDVARTGPLLGEGAAAVVLEPNVEQARYGWLRSVGLSCDAHHPTAPHADGMARSMVDAHRRAGIDAGEVDLVVMHATSTVLNDLTESASHHTVFGDAAGRPLVTGLKGYIGHTSGSASLMSLIVALQAMQQRCVPAIAGLTDPIPEVRDLSLVIGEAVTAEPAIAQINGFGFGGVNAVAVIARADADRDSAVEPVRRTVAISSYSVHVPGAGGDQVFGSATAADMVELTDIASVLGRKGLLYSDPATLLAWCAVQRALGCPDGGRPREPLPQADRTAVVVSSNLGNVHTVCDIVARVARESYRAVSPLELPNASSNVIAAAIALRFGFTGPNLMLCNGATSGVDAVRAGARLIGSGRADRVVVVGVEPADDTATAVMVASGADQPGAVALRAAAACVVLEPARGTGVLVGHGGLERSWDELAENAIRPSLCMVPHGRDLVARQQVDLTARLGETYGAHGVLQAAIAAHLLGTGEHRQALIVAGDRPDGYAWLRLDAERGRQ